MAPDDGLTTAPGNHHASDFISTIRDRAPRLAMTIAASQLLWPAGRKLYSTARERTTYTIKVPSTDDIYDTLHEWVLELLPTEQQRALVAWTSRREGPTAFYDGPTTSRPTRVRLRYDGTREQTIKIDGHKIKILVTQSEYGKEDRWKPPEIVFTTSSLTAQQRLITELGAVAHNAAAAARKPVVRMLDNWGEWQRLDDLPARNLDTVILPHDHLETLVDDIAQFLGAEQDYLRRCIPWHRGHLYEGPPGTGKTSVARAIATHFGMDVWYLPLADVRKDGDLMRVLNRIGPRSMLLLEDADVFHSATERSDGETGVTLSGLLNALDGVATPHGLLTVLTTNAVHALDPALIRPGRIDICQHFDLADSPQIARILTRWFDQPVYVAGIEHRIAAADVIEACKRHTDPADCVDDLRRNAPVETPEWKPRVFPDRS